MSHYFDTPTGREDPLRANSALGDSASTNAERISEDFRYFDSHNRHH